ncbi:sugar ABC transporter ATP-binding protein [Candidatus Aerophobetes bacterium]|nr:sugar ABC transporter ATP-binding protein [Candidatus Aerophobetes bacterium]
MSGKTDKKDILEIKGVTKDFPGVRALDNVDFELRRGEIHGLVGENGAGKTTLLKIIDGALQPTRGEIFLEGEKVSFNNSREAIDWGIGTVHQEMNIIPYFNAIENIFLGRELTKFNFIKFHQLEEKTRDLLHRIGLSIDIDLYQEVRYLGAAERKIIEILRAINLQPKILILDEPTASLTIEEVKTLFDLLRKFKKEGMAIIFVSHHLEEVFEITDRVTVLRNGEKIGTVPTSSIKRTDLIRMMINRDIKSQYPKQKVPIGKPLLEVKGLSTDFLKDISFEVRESEIVGFAGMVSSGRTELMETIFGAKEKRSGEIYLRGQKTKIRSVREAIKNGLRLVPEERREKGIIESFSVRENLTLSHLDDFCRFDYINFNKEGRESKEIVQRLNIETPSISTEAKNLSGGNKQKLSFGKWSFGKGDIFILDEPTEGIDVGSKVEMYKFINKLIKEKAGIVLVSSDLPELLALSDRIYVMREGKIVDVLSGEKLTQENVLESTFGK